MAIALSFVEGVEISDWNSSGATLTRTTSIGAAASDRIVVVAFGAERGNPVTGVTIGGVTASIVIDQNEAGNITTGCVAWAEIPSGTTALLEVHMTSTGWVSPRAAVYRMTGANPAAYDTNFDVANDSGSSSDQPFAYVNVADGGAIVAAHFNRSQPASAAWTGVTGDYFDNSNRTVAAGSASGLAAETGRTITITGGYNNPILAAASFEPAPSGGTTLPRSALVLLTSSIAAIAAASRPRTASIAATGGLTASGTVSTTIQRSAAVTVSAGLAGGATATRGRSASLSSTSSLAAVYSVSGSLTRVAGITSTSSLTAQGARTLRRGAAVASNSGVTGQGVRSVPRTAQVSSISACAAIPTKSLTRTVLMSATGTSRVGTGVGTGRTASVASASGMNATRTITRGRSARVVSNSTLTGARAVSRQRAAAIGSASVVSAARSAEMRRAALVSSGSAVTARAIRRVSGLVTPAARIANVSAEDRRATSAPEDRSASAAPERRTASA